MTKPLWPRFLCKRDAEGQITEERHFENADAVPKGEGWELITPPEAPPTPVALTLAADLKTAEEANLRLSARVVELEKLTATGAAGNLKKALAEVDALKARVAELEAEKAAAPAV